MSRVKEALKWVEVIARSPNKERLRLARRAIDNLQFFKTRSGKPTVEGQKLHKYFNESRNLELIGFTPCLRYLRVKTTPDLPHPGIYSHAWGSPTLVYKVKGKPVIVLVGPDIRFDETVVGEVKKNNYNTKIAGFTG